MLTTVGASKAWALQAMWRALSVLRFRSRRKGTWPGTPASWVRKRWPFANDWEMESGDRRRVEQHQRVVQLPPLGPGLLAATGHVEQQVEQLPAQGLDAGLAVSDLAGVQVHQ